MLPPGKYYKRKPQNTITEKNYKRKLLKKAGAVNYNYGNEYLILIL